MLPPPRQPPSRQAHTPRRMMDRPGRAERNDRAARASPPTFNFSNDIVGCRALTHWITKVPVPRHIWTRNYESNNGPIDPIAYLEKLTQGVRIMGGDTYDMTNILPTCLLGSTPTWLYNRLPCPSIDGTSSPTS